MYHSVWSLYSMRKLRWTYIVCWNHLDLARNAWFIRFSAKTISREKMRGFHEHLQVTSCVNSTFIQCLLYISVGFIVPLLLTDFLFIHSNVTYIGYWILVVLFVFIKFWICFCKLRYFDMDRNFDLFTETGFGVYGSLLLKNRCSYKAPVWKHASSRSR